MGNGDSVLRKEALPENTEILQTDDGTIFYYTSKKPYRLYVKWEGKVVEAKLPELPDRGIRHQFISHGNAIYFVEFFPFQRFHAELCDTNDIYSATFTPPNKLVVELVRYVRKDETIYSSGFYSILRHGKPYVYPMSEKWDDTGGALLQVTDWSEDKCAINFRTIHRGRAVYVTCNSNIKCPLVKRWNESLLLIEVPINIVTRYTTFSRDSSPIIYLLQDNTPHALNTDTMEFVSPLPLQFEYFFYVTSIAGVHNGVITLQGYKMGWMSNEYFLISVQLPSMIRSKEFESEFLKKFEPRGILGQGGFGCVFEARNLIDDWNYAVKRIALKGSDEAVNEALKEVRTLASLKHEGIVTHNHSWIEKPPNGWQKRSDAELLKKLGYPESLIQSQDYSNGYVYIYIQMELCKQSLRGWLNSTKTRDLSQAKKWFKQLVSAIAYLHEKNKIHRDLKPENVLFDMNGRIKICDLGIATDIAIRRGEEIDITRTIIGTRMYMAPEQSKGRYTSKVDVFSLGLILAELCVFMSINQAYEVFMNYRQGRSTTILKRLPEVDQFVTLLTQVDPAKRPTCDEILTRKFLA